MENTRPFHITKAEDQIMNILWSVKEPLSQQQIVMVASDSGEMTFKERSIFTLLNGLMDKGSDYPIHSIISNLHLVDINDYLYYQYCVTNNIDFYTFDGDFEDLISNEHIHILS